MEIITYRQQPKPILLEKISLPAKDAVALFFLAQLGYFVDYVVKADKHALQPIGCVPTADINSEHNDPRRQEVAESHESRGNFGLSSNA